MRFGTVWICVRRSGMAGESVTAEGDGDSSRYCVTGLAEKYVIGLGCGVPCACETASHLVWSNGSTHPQARATRGAGTGHGGRTTPKKMLGPRSSAPGCLFLRNPGPGPCPPGGGGIPTGTASASLGSPALMPPGPVTRAFPPITKHMRLFSRAGLKPEQGRRGACSRPASDARGERQPRMIPGRRTEQNHLR